MNTDFLQQLCNAHSTSANEEEVFFLMKQYFETNKWSVDCNNHYIIANKVFPKDCPTILFVAHADSPGWIITNPNAVEINDNLSYEISNIGYISSCIKAEVVIKTDTKKIEGNLLDGHFIVKKRNVTDVKIKKGDRICFKPRFLLNKTILEATFLDNRIGCFLLSLIANECDNWELKYNIALAVTSSEETDCSGAEKLAENTNADFVIVLDATYEEKNVLLGNGPVLTLRDDGIQLDEIFAEQIIQLISQNGIKIQTEITHGYTETESFAELSKSKRIISLLIAQRNNHSNKEQIDLRDIKSYLEAIKVICCTELPN
jgi:putative aminopeptidase FrvX